jgi:hypothetical protein
MTPWFHDVNPLGFWWLCWMFFYRQARVSVKGMDILDDPEK